MGRIQNLQKCGSWIPLVISRHLVNLIQEEYRILGTALFQRSQNTAWHSPHIGTAMASDFSLISNATQRCSYKFSAKRPGNRAGQGCFTNTWRTHKTHNRRILPGGKLSYSQILQNTLLYLLQSIVVLIQNLCGLFNILIILSGFIPWHIQQGLNVSGNNTGLLGHISGTLQTGNFLIYSLYHVLWILLSTHTLAVAFNIPLNAVLVPQFIMDSLNLLTKIIFLLNLFNLLADTSTNLLLNIQNFPLTLQHTIKTL